MPGGSLTNKPVSEELKESSYVVVSQDEEVNGTVLQALRKIPVSVLSKYLGVDELKKIAALIPLENSNVSRAIGFEDRIVASIINTSGELEAVDSEYAYCAHYTGLGAYVGKELHVSGACRQTAPLYVFKDIDGNVIDMGWGNGEETLTVVEKYPVIVPEDAEEIYVNQLCEFGFIPCVVEPIKKVSIGEDDLSEDFKKNTKKTFSNALKGTASGAVVALNDVSPVEHEVECVVKSKNILKYPYFFSGSRTTNGVTFTENGDGSVTVNGTATAGAAYALHATSNPLYIPKGTTITGKKITDTATGISFAIQRVINGATSGVVLSLSMYDTTKVTDCDYFYVYLYVNAGFTIDNITVYPQIEIGQTSTDWKPYVAPETVTLSKYGKNLCPKTTLSVSGTEAYKNGACFMQNIQPGDYVAQAKFKQTGTQTSVGINIRKVIRDENGTISSYEKMNTNKTSDLTSGVLTQTVTITEFGEYQIQLFGNITSNSFESEYVAEFTDIQFEVDNGTGLPTAFENPVTAVVYTPTEDGTVEGVASIAPNMTLMTDTPNTYIDVKYNRDINKAFEEMYNAIISLGGNV